MPHRPAPDVGLGHGADLQRRQHGPGAASHDDDQPGNRDRHAGGDRGGPGRPDGLAARLTGWSSPALGVAAVVGHGLFHKGLPGESLTFRWHYWVGAAFVFVRHVVAGVGVYEWKNAKALSAQAAPAAPAPRSGPGSGLPRQVAEPAEAFATTQP